MKAHLEEDGTLTISAENGMERFALSHWFTMWTQHKAVLHVQTIEPAPQAVKALDLGVTG